MGSNWEWLLPARLRSSGGRSYFPAPEVRPTSRWNVGTAAHDPKPTILLNVATFPVGGKKESARRSPFGPLLVHYTPNGRLIYAGRAGCGGIKNAELRMPVPRGKERLPCSGCGSRKIDMVVSGTERR